MGEGSDNCSMEQVQVKAFLLMQLTILASECIGSPDGEMEPLVLMGGPGIPGMLGTMDIGRASYMWRRENMFLEVELLLPEESSRGSSIQMP